MSRIDGRIEGADDQAIDASDILAALASQSAAEAKRRQDAVRCYLSVSDGWREASSMLGGAFAPGETGLNAEKDE